MSEKCHGLGEYVEPEKVVQTADQIKKAQEKILAEREKIKEIQARTGLKDYAETSEDLVELENIVSQKNGDCKNKISLEKKPEEGERQKLTNKIALISNIFFGFFGKK